MPRDPEKRRASWRAYYYRNAAAINYGRSRRRLRQRIEIKRQKLADLKAQLKDAPRA